MTEILLPTREYDLAATLTSGQVFRWELRDNAWEGVIGSRWVRLQPRNEGILAQALEPVSEWSWLTEYLQSKVKLENVLATFPQDEPMRAAVAAHPGLRLLRQDPWECLASFILSSTKQIIQIRQIVEQLCKCYGETVKVPDGRGNRFSFPTAARLVQASEADLRACKMGFRAKYLLDAARSVNEKRLDLAQLRNLSIDEARDELLKLPGVGVKIANCVLLFAYGFSSAFPVDVWVARALRQLYFPRRRVSMTRMKEFAATHFGPHGGYAQQYLFHYMRRAPKRKTR